MDGRVLEDSYSTEYKRNNALRQQRRRRLLIDSWKTGPCMDCRKCFPAVCMDFDHRPGEVKKLNVSVSITRSLSSLKAEIAKCDLVCACCHRLRTANRTKYVEVIEPVVKTTCKYGHSPERYLTTKRNKRRCLECELLRSRARRRSCSPV